MRGEWALQEWDFPNVKGGHREKVKDHPCQFPIELAERCVLAFSVANDLVLDPFSGTGTTAVAANFTTGVRYPSTPARGLSRSRVIVSHKVRTCHGD